MAEASFRDWLAVSLENDGYISDAGEVTESTTLDQLCCETEVEAADLDTYKSEFEEYCAVRGFEPEFDIPEY